MYRLEAFLSKRLLVCGVFSNIFNNNKTIETNINQLKSIDLGGLSMQISVIIPLRIPLTSLLEMRTDRFWFVPECYGIRFCRFV